jgi:predicted porin
MKKPLLLLSTLVIVGTASAQSSVKVFGIVDARLARGTGSKANINQMLDGGLSASRLGFRGVEDLGGGLSASFWLEAGMNVGAGSGQASNSNNQASGTVGGGGLTFNRRSTVSLAGNWGEARLGRDFVPQYLNLFYGDPFGNRGVGASINDTAIITGVVSTRASNMISYLTPAGLGGFAAKISHYLGESPSGTPNSDDGTGDGISVYYTHGPLRLRASWGRTRYAAGDVKQRNLNAAWNFGAAKVMGTYSSDTNGAVAAHGGSVGLSVPMGVGELKAAYSRYRKNAAGSPEGRKLALGYVHNLSKTTALYATYAHVSNSGGASFALNGASTAANESSNGLDLGLRHSF